MPTKSRAGRAFRYVFSNSVRCLSLLLQMTDTHESSLPRLGGKSAMGLFVAVLLAFVVETQLTQVSVIIEWFGACIQVSCSTSRLPLNINSLISSCE